MTTFYCDPNLSTGSDTGTSWENAFWNFEDLIAALTDGAGDSGFVKAGTISNISAEINMPGSAYLYGGFSRELKGTDVSEREWLKNKTIIDMTNAYGTTTPWGCIGPGATPENDVRIDGFHFVNCDNQQTSTNGYGGAIHAMQADAWKIYNCKFVNCTVSAGKYGGAVCLNTDNSAGGHCVLGCIFEDCETGASTGGENGGGAIAVMGTSSTLISNCKFENCYGPYGGAVALLGSGDSIIEDCVFIGCDSIGGDAIYVSEIYADHIIKRCHIRDCIGDNSVIFSACFDSDSVNLFIKNSTITGCTGSGVATITGESYPNNYDHVYVVNCTIADNSQYGLVRFFMGVGSSFYCYNSIIYGNTSGQIYGTLTACQYSDVQGGYTGTGNVNVDPNFAGASHCEPYAMDATSTCVDGASAGVTGYDAVDITQFTRTGTPDMGAIEYKVIVPGAIDCSMYHLDMGQKATSIVAPRDMMNFAFPYLLQAEHRALQDTAHKEFQNPIDPNLRCYPLWFGGEYEIDNADARILERFMEDTSNRSIYRNNTQATDPSWSSDFEERYESIDSSIWGTYGLPSHGSKYQVPNEKEKFIFEVIRYSCKQIDSPSKTDALKVYNVWVEGHPFITKDTEYAAKWLDASTSVSVSDIPVSSGLMIELVRLLNILTWECRSPLSCPVFGIFWPPAPFPSPPIV